MKKTTTNAELRAKQDQKIKESYDRAIDESVDVFGTDALFTHDCIKQIMQQHKLDARDTNLKTAFIRLATGIKKREYPKNK